MAFKLNIGDVIEFSVKGSVNDGARSIPFNFALQGRRLQTAEYRDVLKPDSDVLIREFLAENLTGWRGQRLVLDDADAPAAYSAEALACLLGVVGMEQTLFQGYLKALHVSETPAGRAGN